MRLDFIKINESSYKILTSLEMKVILCDRLSHMQTDS